MSDTGTVQGVVVDSEGHPVPQATIVVVGGTAPVPEIALIADGSGRFGLRLPRGRFTLEAQGEGEVKGRSTIDVTGPSHETRIKLK